MIFDMGGAGIWTGEVFKLSLNTSPAQIPDPRMSKIMTLDFEKTRS